jgi:hypothetical protein
MPSAQGVESDGAEPDGAEPAATGRSPVRANLLELAREILGLIAAIGTLSLVLRALIVAHFDLTVTGALTANASTTAFVTSTLVQVGPLALYAGAVLAAYQAGVRLGTGGRAPAYLYALTAVLAVPLLGTSEFLVALLVLAGLPVAFLIGRTRHRRAVLVRLAAWLGAAVLLVNFLPVRMWLPPERAIVGGDTKTVYVLRESSDGVVIFDPGSVSVLRIPLGQIRDRQFCQSGERLTVGEFLLGRAERQVPTCP